MSFRGFHHSGSAGRNKPRPDLSHAKPTVHPPRKETMHCLVVCGAKNADVSADAAMFSDFMGISMTLRMFQPEVEGTFMSCFPLEEHFQRLARMVPPITDIKRGQFGAKGRPMFAYSKEKFDKKAGLWYSHYSPATIYTEVLTWIWRKTREAQPGDTVNIFFQCHGDQDGILLGPKVLMNSTVADLLNKFLPGVQVNAIGSHCYSGRLVNAIKAQNQRSRYIVAAAGEDEEHWSAGRSVSNRIRNFRFSQPFVQSLARARLPQIEQIPASPISVAEHDKFMLEAMRGPPGTGSTYMTYLSPEKEAALAQLEELILRDYADVAFQTETVARRRRREWPSMEGIPQDIMLGKKTSNPPAAAKTEAMNLINAASRVCNKDRPLVCDSGIVENLFFFKPPDYEYALKILYWRGRQSSAIWDLFCILCHRKFLSMKSLIHEMRFNPLNKDVMGVMSILKCFEYTSTEYLMTTFPQDDMFRIPIIWLATVIVRSCIEPDKMFALIEYTGILGKFNIARLNSYREGIFDDTKFGYDPHAMEGTSQGVFGFWLPHGIGEDRTRWPGIIRARVQLFNNSERVFKSYFRIPDDKIITEEMQDQYFRQRSHLEPGYRYSGQLKK